MEWLLHNTQLFSINTLFASCLDLHLVDQGKYRSLESLALRETITINSVCDTYAEKYNAKPHSIKANISKNHVNKLEFFIVSFTLTKPLTFVF